MKGEVKLKSNIPIMIFLMSIVLIAGCAPSNSVKIKNENIISNVDEKVLKMDDSGEEFSYLTDLSEEKLKSYKLFTKEYDTNYLKDFSPEQILLIYIHSAVIDDIEAIYALAYINGNLYNFDTFKENYYQNLNNSTLEMALDFRYYDSIKIKQEDGIESIVELTITYGRFTASTFMELKKENDLWKIVLSHSFNS